MSKVAIVDSQTTTFILTSLLVKPALMLLLVWMLSFIVRKQSAAFQHFVLALGILGVLVLPILGSLLPGIDWHSIPIMSDLARVVDEKLLALLQIASLSSEPSQWLWMTGIYCWIFTWIVYYQLLGLVGLALHSRRAKEVTDGEFLALRDQLCELLDIHASVRLKTSGQVSSPYMWGLVNPVILLPRESVLWDGDKKLSVLMHELGHVARRDWIVSQLVQFTCALFWFLPPLWWLANKLYDHAEIACDDLIFRLRDKHVIYAQNLLQLAGADAPSELPTGLGMQGHSSIYWRIAAVLDKRRPREPVALESAQYWFITGMFLLVFMASIQVIPLQPEAKPLVVEWVTTQLPLLPHPDSSLPEESDAVDWQSLKYTHQAPPVERVSVSTTILRLDMPNAEFVEMTGATELQKEMALPVPQISIQGYLPIEIVSPEYPQSALVRGIEGRILVEFTIDQEGLIRDPHIISRSMASTLFDKAVLAAIRKSRYHPQVLDGEPIELRGVTEEFIFKLEPADSYRRR